MKPFQSFPFSGCFGSNQSKNPDPNSQTFSTLKKSENKTPITQMKSSERSLFSKPASKSLNANKFRSLNESFKRSRVSEGVLTYPDPLPQMNKMLNPYNPTNRKNSGHIQNQGNFRSVRDAKRVEQVDKKKGVDELKSKNNGSLRNCVLMNSEGKNGFEENYELKKTTGKRNWLELPNDIKREIYSMEFDTKKIKTQTDILGFKNKDDGNLKIGNIQNKKNMRDDGSKFFFRQIEDFNNKYILQKNHNFQMDYKQNFFGFNDKYYNPRKKILNRNKIIGFPRNKFFYKNKFEYNANSPNLNNANNKINLHSKLIKCKLCQINIIKSKQKTKKNLKYNKNEKLLNSSKNSKLIIGDEPANQEETITLISDSEFEKSKEIPLTFKTFGKAYSLMIKLVCEDQILPQDLEMPETHRMLVIEFMKKKKLCKKFELKDFSIENLMHLRSNENTRRTEERLKFIFKKCIRYIQARFKRKMKHKFNDEKSSEVDDTFSESVKFDYIFYGHYYSKIAEQIGQPIEKFFHFRNWKNRTSEHIPKSITKVYVNYLKMNPSFMNLFISYMNDRLIKDIVLNNIKKIFRLVKDWENILKKFDQEQGMEIVLKKFRNKGVKLPWGLTEVRSAIKDTLKYIIKD
jgi:hypothetical protein